MTGRLITDKGTYAAGRVILETLVVFFLTLGFSSIKLWRMPQGGEVSLVMLPLIVFALLRGPLPGFFAGLAFGFFHSLLNPMLDPMQCLLDYPLAYGSAGLAGFFARYAFESHLSMAAVAAAMAGMYICRTLSGYLFAGLFLNPAPQNPLLYSVLYNASYMIPDTVIIAVIVASFLPLFRKAFTG